MQTYPEMNEKIVGILQQHGDPVVGYAAARIEELEQQLQEAEGTLAIATAALEWHATAGPAGQAVGALEEIETILTPDALLRIVELEAAR